MALNSNKDQKVNRKLTPKQKIFLDFLEGASNQSKEFDKPKLYKIWNILIYGSFAAIGIFLVYLYSAYIYINK